jgi:hypothetical protein
MISRQPSSARRLVHDFGDGPADLGPAHVRHHAIRAVVVAAAHDAEERPAAVRPDRDLPRLRNRRVLAARQDAARAAARNLDQLGDAREFPRAADEVHVRQPLEDFSAVLLRHAAEDADDQAGLAALQAFQFADVAVHALLGVRAHRAGVVEHHVRLVRRGGLFVAGAPERGERQLGVQLVHLAAEGVDEDLAGHGLSRGVHEETKQDE